MFRRISTLATTWYDIFPNVRVTQDRGASQTQENIIIDETLVNIIKQSTLQRWRETKKKRTQSRARRTILVLEWKIGCTQISTRVSTWVWKYSTNRVMVYSSYFSWDHIAMVCENWISQLISDLTHNNILATLIYIHTQLFMSIDVMVWVSTYLGCKVWVVNCKLLLLFNMVGSCYIIDEGCSSMWVAWCKNWSWKSNITKEEISPLGASMCVVPFSISLVGISKVKNQKTNIVNYYHSQYFPFFMS